MIELPIYDVDKKEFFSFFIKAQEFILKENEHMFVNCRNDDEKNNKLNRLWKDYFSARIYYDSLNSKIIFDSEDRKMLFLIKWSD